MTPSPPPSALITIRGASVWLKGDVLDMISFLQQTDLAITLCMPEGRECLIARLPVSTGRWDPRPSFPYPLTGKVPDDAPVLECTLDLSIESVKVPGVVRGDLRLRPGLTYVSGLSGAVEVACALRIDGLDDASDVIRTILDEARKKRRRVIRINDLPDDGDGGSGGGDLGGDSGMGGQLPS